LHLVMNFVLLSFNLLSLFYVGSCNKRLASIFNTMKSLQVELKRLELLQAKQKIEFIVVVVQFATIIIFFGYAMSKHQISENSWQNIFNLVVIVSRAFSVASVTCIGTHFCAICIILKCYVKSVASELKSIKQNTEKNHAEKLAKLRYASRRVFELAHEANEIFGLFLLLALIYHNGYLQIDLFNTGKNIYNFTSGRAKWISTNNYFLGWILIDVGKGLIYFISATQLENEVNNNNILQI